MTYLSKEKLVDGLNKTPMIAQHIDCMDLFDAINNSIAENVSEVVRCKDCKHGEKVPTFKYYPNVTWCNKYLTSHNDNWFCADGEREEI